MERYLEKTLVIILSETRAFELTFDKFRSNLLSVFNADLALCVADSPHEDKQNPFYTHAKFIWTYEEKGDWAEALDEVAAERGSSQDWRILLYLGGILFGGVKGVGEQPGSAAILIFFRAFLKHNLVNEGLFDRYDRFVLTRSDFLHEVPHLPPRLLDGEYIWFPDGEHYGGYTDRHIVCSSKDFLDYLSVCDAVFEEPHQLFERMNKRKYWNIEQFLKFRMNELRLSEKVRFYPYTMYLVRAAEGRTNWAEGYWDEKQKLFVKYADEYKASRTAMKVLEGHREWNDKLVRGYFELLRSALEP